VHLIGTPPSPGEGAKTEFDLLAALFSPAGREDPQVILRGSPLPGCQYLFVRDVLRDPRFALCGSVASSSSAENITQSSNPSGRPLRIP
jgi:hypothetical protein